MTPTLYTYRPPKPESYAPPLCCDSIGFRAERPLPRLDPAGPRNAKPLPPTDTSKLPEPTERTEDEQKLADDREARKLAQYTQRREAPPARWTNCRTGERLWYAGIIADADMAKLGPEGNTAPEPRHGIQWLTDVADSYRLRQHCARTAANDDAPPNALQRAA